MQTGQFSFKKSLWLLLLSIAAFSLLIISSCSSGKKSKNPTCVKLTKAQIQKWVNKGYTDPSNPNYMTSVRFTTAYAGPGAVFRVFVIGQRKNYSLITESLTELSPVDTCNKTHIKLSDFIFTGTIPADLSDLNILKTNGKVIDSLLYLKLQPFDYTDPKTYYDYLAYDVSVVGKKGIITRPSKEKGKETIGLPCPPCPNCNKSSCPPPPTCETCGPAVDSTKRHD